MGYVFKKDDFQQIIRTLSKTYRLYAPVLKVGEGRFTDTDVVRYDFVTEADEICLDRRSDYSFKEILSPLSETLFYFTDGETAVAKKDVHDTIVFLRSCDMHALKRLDDMYLRNGDTEDYFYNRIREKLHFVLIGCRHSFADCFCASMGSNVTEGGFLFSIEEENGTYRSDVREENLKSVFEETAAVSEEVTAAHVTENDVKVTVPAEIPNTIFKHPLWDEYNERCIGCGRCNFVCPTCTCFSIQDLFYKENGKVGERRRVAASCMVDGYTNVAGGGQYRRNNGERMRFKVLHKISDHRKRFGHDMCIGCGRCDAVCPEYISFSTLINKVNDAVKEEK